MIKNRFVLIDAFALIHRAYHALPAFTNRSGQPIGAVYGFSSALLSAIRELQPEFLAVGIDLPAPTKRKEEYKEYKIHRQAPPDDMIVQVPVIKEVLKAFNIPIFAAEGYEGEDAIASIITKCKKANQNLEFIIVTGDMDTLQLINGQTKVYSMARGANQAVMYDTDKVIERYGLEPSQFVDFKALKGDTSDNIPGVPGIGEKTAAKLIAEHKSLDTLYKNIDKLPDKIKKLLSEYKDQAYLSQSLSRIVTDLPVDFELEDAHIHGYNYDEVIYLFENLGFNSLIKRVPKPLIKAVSKQKESQGKLF